MRNKKILGLLLAGVMVTSIPFNVFADDESEKLELSEVNTPVAVAQEKDETKPAGEKTDPKEGEVNTCKVTFKDGSKEEVFDGVEKNEVLPNNKKPTDPKKDGFTSVSYTHLTLPTILLV